jgi:Sel1 repeat
MQSRRCPRYAIHGAFLLMLAATLFGCRKEQSYPGFTLVGVDGKVSYFVNASTIRRATGAEQFSFVQLIENPAGEYDVGEAMVDCDSLMSIAGESGHYDSQKHFISNTPQHTQSIASIAIFVCPQRKTSPPRTGSSNSEEVIPAVQNLAANQQTQGSNSTAKRTEAPQGSTLMPAENSKPFAAQSEVPQEPKPVANPNPPAHPPSIAEIDQQAVELFNQKRYADSLPLFNRACGAREADACYYLGVMHEFGRGVARDFSRERELYLKACEAGNRPACSDLDILQNYEPDLLQCKSTPLANMVNRYTDSCNAGSSESCNTLGHLYSYGCSVAMDTEKARQLYSRACTMGNQQGCERLKEMQ